MFSLRNISKSQGGHNSCKVACNLASEALYDKNSTLVLNFSTVKVMVWQFALGNWEFCLFLKFITAFKTVKVGTGITRTLSYKNYS